MSLPETWTQKPVVGDYREITGKLLAGKVVSFTCDRVMAFDGQQRIVPGRFTATLDSDGKIPSGFTLPALDDPHLDDPTGTYTVKEHWTGGRTFSIAVSVNDTEVNMATVSPVADPQEWSSVEEAALASALGVAATAAKDAAESAADTATTKAAEASASAQAASDSADAAAASAADTVNSVKGDPAKKYRTFGGVIRQASVGAGWAFIDNTNHQPIGMGAITENANGTLTVASAFTADRVGAIAITPDEDYASAGLTVGASVTTSNMILSFYAPFEVRMSNVTPAWGNFLTTTDDWVTCDTSTAGTDGKVVFTHPALTHTDSAGSAVLVTKYMPSGTSNGNAEIIPISLTKTGFTLQAMEPICAKVVTNGSGVVTVTSELVSNPTATWDAVNNQLEVAHPTALSANACSIQMLTGNYVAVVKNQTTAAFDVEFYDFAGTKYTGAAAPASTQFLFSRPGNAPGVWSAQNRLVIRRATVKVRCQDVQGSGNIWIAGTHEVA